MKKLAAALLAAALLVLPAQAVSGGAPTVDAAAAVLMEKETGASSSMNRSAHDTEPPASPKLMTLLLVWRWALDDMGQPSPPYVPPRAAPRSI